MDIDYGALFGLEQPDDTTGVNDAEVRHLPFHTKKCNC